jgi:hypothetical protein
MMYRRITVVPPPCCVHTAQCPSPLPIRPTILTKKLNLHRRETSFLPRTCLGTWVYAAVRWLVISAYHGSVSARTQFPSSPDQPPASLLLGHNPTVESQKIHSTHALKCLIGLLQIGTAARPLEGTQTNFLMVSYAKAK